MEGKIYQALGNVMMTVGAVEKSQVNQAQKFKFRGIDDVMNALHSAFAKAGIVVMPSELEHIQDVYETETTYNGVTTKKMTFRSRLHMAYRFISAEDGSYVEADGWGEAMDNGDKGYNKCKSIAYKYILMQMFLIPTEDIEEPDKEVHEVVSETPALSDLDLALSALGKIPEDNRKGLTDLWKKFSVKLSDADKLTLQGNIKSHPAYGK